MNRIKELRDSLKMTQDEFAEHCGISRSSIARYERGENLKSEIALIIANACDVTTDYLLGKEMPQRNAPLTAYELLPVDEKPIIDLFRKLTDAGKEKAFEYLLLLQHEYRAEDKKTHA